MRSQVKSVVGKSFLAALAFSIAFASCSEKQQLSRKDLKIAAGDLRTLALASSRIAESFDRDDVTQIFYTNQSELLLEKVTDTAKQLEGYGEQPEQEQERVSLFNIAESLEADLGNSQKGKMVAAEELNMLAQQAKTIEDNLKEK